MKRRAYGPSLYYASDKNIFDALNQHKVDAVTVTDLFRRRNTIVSAKTHRDDLAKYFARLMHDYQDHQAIARRLGIAPRRERITYMDVAGIREVDDIKAAVEQLKQELAKTGEVIQVEGDGDNLSIHVQYSTVDYKVSEFAQVQIRDGTVDFIRSADGYIVRNTQNEYVNDVRDTLLAKLEKASGAALDKVSVSLFDIPEPKLRSKFFHELITKLPGFTHRDVTAAYVYKAKPADDADSEETDNSLGSDPDTHVERVQLRGKGVSRSELLKELLEVDDYYITKIAWTVSENLGDGHYFDIEAAFTEPEACTGFSFILSGVCELEDGVVSSRRRAPSKSEIAAISQVIESKSRELVAQMRDEYSKLNAGGA